MKTNKNYIYTHTKVVPNIHTISVDIAVLGFFQVFVW